MTTLILPPMPRHEQLFLVSSETQDVMVKSAHCIVYREEGLELPILGHNVFVARGTRLSCQWHEPLKSWLAYPTPEKNNSVFVTTETH